MMVLLPYVHDDDDDEDNDGNDNDDDDGFLHKKKHKLTTCQSTNFDAFLTICDRFLCPFFLVFVPLSLPFKCLFITFPAFCDITWAFFNKLLII